MAREWTLVRQEAEGLVDYLEEQPNRVIHDKTNLKLAAELREMFGMCSREEELRRAKEMDRSPRRTIDLNVEIYEGPPTIIPDLYKK